MATNLSAHSVIHNGPSRSAVVVESENRLIAVVDSLIHIGKLQHNKRHEELTVLENSVIDLGAYLSALQIPWPKPMDRLGTVLVEILECGQKLWSTRWYFAVNPRMPTKKPDQIEDELERELYPEQTALAEETERERIETERDKYANEDRYYHSRLSSQLRTMTQWPETKLREMQSRGSEIICEMIDPCNTDQNRGEPDPPKLPKVQPSLTNPIVTGDSLAPPALAAETPTAERDAPAVDSEQPPVVATPSAIPPAVPTVVSEQLPKVTGKKRGIPIAEAEILVRDWLFKHAKEDPKTMRVKRISKDTGVSTGQFPNLKCWKAFKSKRDERQNSEPRTVPLNEWMMATVSVNEANDQKRSVNEANDQKRNG